MKHSLFAFLAFSLLAPVAALSLEGESTARGTTEEEPQRPRVHRSDAGVFRVIALEAGHTRLFEEVSERLERNALRFFSREPALLRPIRVQLVPEGMGDLGEDSYRIFIGEDGAHTLALRWNEDLSFFLFCEAVALVYLKQLALERHGREASREVPIWLASAHGIMLQVAFRPSMRFYFQDRGRNMAILAPEDIFRAEEIELDDADFRLNAFWMHEAILGTLSSSERVRAFFDGLLADGGEAEALLRRNTDTIGNRTEDLHQWWVVSLKDVVHRRIGPIESRRESARWLSRKLEFDLIIDSVRSVVPVDEIWPLRREEAVAELTRLRVRQIEAHLPRAHPVFANSAAALLVVYQSLQQNNEREFNRAIQRLAEEWEMALSIHRGIESLRRE
jgi:hypothetical protein